MREKIIDFLHRITPEEQSILDKKLPSLQAIYSKPGRFIIERRHISNIVFGDSTAPISLRAHPRFCPFPVHSHDFIEIMYVCKGKIKHSFGSETVELLENDLIVIGKDSAHSIDIADTDDLCINIMFSPDLFEKLLNTLHSVSGYRTERLESMLRGNNDHYCIFHTEGNLAITNLLEIMIDSVIISHSYDTFTLEETLKLLLCHIASLPEELTFSKSENKTDDKNKKKIMNYIRTSYSTATLTEAAEMLGLTPTYLSRWIYASFGHTFKELLMNERFNTARELLQNTDMSIGEIIYHIGYENSSYFHKEFKKRFGVTPKNFRKGS